MKTIIFNEILNAVEQITEVRRDHILSREKEREIVDARSLVIHYLCINGFTKSQTARLTGHSRQCVSVLEEGFRNRQEANGNIMSILIQQINNIVVTKGLKPIPLK